MPTTGSCLRFFSRRLLPALFAATLAAAPLHAAPQVELAAPATVAAYDFAEVTLKVTGSAAKNPFTEATVAGTFGRKGETPLVVDGFCDSADGSVFRIRFMPTRPGDYDFHVKYREGTFERTLTGSFAATEGQRKGLLRVDPEYPAHFQWEGSKERFFWNGTAADQLAGRDDDTIRMILERLDRLKFTLVRAALGGEVPPSPAPGGALSPTDNVTIRLEPWVARDPAGVAPADYDVTRFNVAYWQKWERLLQEARRRDMVVAVVFSMGGAQPGADPFGQAGRGGADEQRYFRYAVARLGAFANVMWDVANEYRAFRDDAWAEKMGTFLKQCDPYDHLTSIHGQGDFRFRQSPWADFATYQNWDEHGGYDFMLKNRQEQEKTGRRMPQVNVESGYEEHNPSDGGENRSAAIRVRLAWETYLAGGYQTTGGGWLNGREDDTLPLLDPYGHIYDFFTGIPWWELQPDTDLVVSVQPHPAAKAEANAKPRAFAARSPEGDLAAIYIAGGGIVTLKNELLRDQLKPLWFSPRDGGMRNARALRDRVYRTPTADDWVLLFRTPCNCSFRDFDNEFER